MMNREQIKKILYGLGKLLSILGLGFLFYKLSKEYTLESFYSHLVAYKFIILPLIIINLLSPMIGIVGWRLMLKKYAKKGFSYLTAYYYYSKTEIAKYLPGNVFHFVGRQAMASKLGISQMEMAKVSLLHNIFLIIGTFAATTAFTLFSSSIDIKIKLLLVIATIGSIVAIMFMYPSFSKTQKLKLAVVFAISIGLHGIMMGWIMQVQVKSMDPSLFFEVAAIYIISWFIGLVTPGASGGLGVREGAFIAIAKFLHLPVATEVVLFSILFVRFVNILVDLLMYLTTFLLPKRIIETIDL